MSICVADISCHNGYPAIQVNGEILPPMQATIRTNNHSDLIIDSDYYRELGRAGIRIFYLICDTQWLKPNALELFDKEAGILLKAVPYAFIIPRIGLHPPLPWFYENTDDLVLYSDGKHHPVHLFSESYEADLPAMYSLCSGKWRADASKALSDTYDAIESLPYADRIIGYFLAAGQTSEWYYPDNEVTAGGVYNDFCPAFLKDYSKYLVRKYGTREELRAAWNDPDATFENPKVPTVKERYIIGMEEQLANPPPMLSNSPVPEQLKNGTNIGSFIDANHYRHVVDYYQCRAFGVAESIIHFGSVVKDKSQGTKLVGAFYGGVHAGYFKNGSSAGILRILESNSVDMLASPCVYENRQPGGHAGQRQMVESYRLRNKIYIVEEDARTHMENSYYANLAEVYDTEDSINILKRDFGRNICEDTNAWWFDQLLGGRRYKHPEIYRLFARQQEIAKTAYSLNRNKKNEIAFIYDSESLHVVSQGTTSDTYVTMRNYELPLLGASGDSYLHNDMGLETMPSYKLYVFFNAYWLNDTERRAIHAKLRRDRAVALWMYAPGFANPDHDKKVMDIGNISELTGINTMMLDEARSSRFKINGSAHKAFNSLDRGKIYGTFDKVMKSNIRPNPLRNRDTGVYPVFYTDDPGATVTANFLSANLPAVTVKEMDGWTSIYCGAKYIQSDFLRAVARYAGCHIYSDTDDVLYASRNFICIHASYSGEKKICFPVECSPHEVYEEKTYGYNIKKIKFTMLRGETRFFLIN